MFSGGGVTFSSFSVATRRVVIFVAFAIDGLPVLEGPLAVDAAERLLAEILPIGFP